MFSKFLIIAIGFAGLSGSASAQIISQTPRPEVIHPEDGTIETIKPNVPIGRTGNTLKTLRTGALLFAGFDKNSDYVIDATEVSAGILAAFAYADINNNNVLSLVELERWRLEALGYDNATPTSFTFAPNFARTVSLETFSAVLYNVAETLDTDDQGERDGKISMGDLLKNYVLPRTKRGGDNCFDRVRQAKREAEQICRNRRGY
ncbi:MAG: hypothetical protein JKX72_03875 [Robiginitomaculum sp.]|nr:hypothetical protein [Robiginitomaculum sp.]